MSVRIIPLEDDRYLVQELEAYRARWGKATRERVVREATVADYDAAYELADTWLAERESSGPKPCGV